mmetsp:Transcript_13226/g.33912  ORF Transcript_13226/g.33912 Transcript_13226/m.33912 type:complete len:226 (-) Transcript_13226:254-931(-)
MWYGCQGCTLHGARLRCNWSRRNQASFPPWQRDVLHVGHDRCQLVIGLAVVFVECKRCSALQCPLLDGSLLLPVAHTLRRSEAPTTRNHCRVFGGGNCFPPSRVVLRLDLCLSSACLRLSPARVCLGPCKLQLGLGCSDCCKLFRGPILILAPKALLTIAMRLHLGCHAAQANSSSYEQCCAPIAIDRHAEDRCWSKGRRRCCASLDEIFCGAILRSLSKLRLTC